VNDTIDLRAGLLDAVFGESGDQIGAVVYAVGGHDFRQSPRVVDLSFHDVSSLPKSSASLMVTTFDGQ
jgi:hypothetical protein